jgi:putative PIN family toxin of toxin-antitoxin system
VRIVLDTNVVVSGMLSELPPPGRVLDMVYSGELTLIFDERIVAEYVAVLSRPRFRFQPGDIDAFLTIVREGEAVVAPPLPLTLSDPSDLKFIEVGVAGGADAMVTGNVRDFRVAEGKLDLPVVTPRQLVERVRRGR